VSNPQPPIGLSQATAPSAIATGVVNSSLPSPWDYDHTVHLLRRSLAFPPPRRGHCKPPLRLASAKYTDGIRVTDDDTQDENEKVAA
jgi:hypothetical protein